MCCWKLDLPYVSLWYTVGGEYTAREGEWAMTASAAPRSLLIASEPLTVDTSTWLEAPEYSMITAALDSGFARRRDIRSRCLTEGLREFWELGLRGFHGSGAKFGEGFAREWEPTDTLELGSDLGVPLIAALPDEVFESADDPPGVVEVACEGGFWLGCAWPAELEDA